MQKIKESHKEINLYSLVATALLVAVSVAMAPLNIYIPLFGASSIRFTVTDIPVFISGALFGPLLGAISGFLGDVLGYMVAPAGPYFWGFTLNKMLVGLIPGMIFYCLAKGSLWEQEKIKKVNTGLALLALVGSIIYINVIAIEDIKSIGSIQGIPMNIILSIGTCLSVLALILVVRKLSQVFEKHEGLYKLQTVTLAVSLNYMIVSLILAPIWVYALYNVPIFASVIARVFKSIVDVPLHIAICYIILQKVRVKLAC